MQLSIISRFISCRSGANRKFVRAMKITAILLLSACLNVSAKGKSQTVTLDMKNAPIQKVITEVIRQSGVSVIYNEAIFKDAPSVTIRVKDASVQDVFDKCLSNLPFSYTMEG